MAMEMLTWLIAVPLLGFVTDAFDDCHGRALLVRLSSGDLLARWHLGRLGSKLVTAIVFTVLRSENLSPTNCQRRQTGPPPDH